MTLDFNIAQIMMQVIMYLWICIIFLLHLQTFQ